MTLGCHLNQVFSLLTAKLQELTPLLWNLVSWVFSGDTLEGKKNSPVLLKLDMAPPSPSQLGQSCTCHYYYACAYYSSVHGQEAQTGHILFFTSV